MGLVKPLCGRPKHMARWCCEWLCADDGQLFNLFYPCLCASQVLADKEREVLAGHDGTWVAHPDLVGLAMSVFNRCVSGHGQ
jgi:hypothetical protein